MKLSREIMVGMTALAALVTFVILISWLGSFRLAGEGYTFLVHFKDVNGLLEGAPVTLRGVQVGKVERLDAEPTQVVVQAWIKYKSTKIPKDSTISIGTKGIIGEKYLQIIPKEDLARAPEFIRPGDTLTGKDPARLEDLIASGQEVLTSLKQLSTEISSTLGDPEVKRSLKSIVSNLDETSRNLASSTKEIDKFVRNPENTRNLSEAIKNMNSSMEKLNKVLTDVDKITGDPEVTKGVKESIRGFGSISKTLGGISLTDTRLHASLLSQTMSPVPDNRLRPDLGASFRSRTDQTFELEVTDVGRTSAIQAQMGIPLSQNSRMRVGIVDSKVGIGADYYAQEQWKIGLSVSDPVAPQGLINTLYWITPNYALQLEYRNIFSTGANTFAGGVRYSP